MFSCYNKNSCCCSCVWCTYKNRIQINNSSYPLNLEMLPRQKLWPLISNLKMYNIKAKLVNLANTVSILLNKAGVPIPFLLRMKKDNSNLCFFRCRIIFSIHYSTSLLPRTSMQYLPYLWLPLSPPSPLPQLFSVSPLTVHKNNICPCMTLPFGY